jgi:hypothetical protein
MSRLTSALSARPGTFAPLLSSPIDSVVLVGVNVGIERIYQVDSKRLYCSIQPRVWFDDVRGDRTREDM